MISVSISISCLIYTVLLTIVFFSKKRIDYIENKVYSYLLIVSLIGIILDSLSGILFLNNFNTTSFIYVLLMKFIILFYITWDIIMITYIFLISDTHQNINYKKYFKIFGFLYIILLFLTMAFPIKVVINDGLPNPVGLCVDLVYLVTFSFVIIVIITLIKNFKSLKNKKYLPLFVYLGMGALVLLVQNLTGYLLMTGADVFIVFLMYFTIENPDVQMINTLIRNKELVENTVNDKANFLFKVSQEMKSPIKNIIDNVKLYKDSKSEEEKSNLIDIVEQDANNAYFIINNITNISSMDYKKIKMQHTTYMTKKLFADIESNIKNQLSLSGKDEKIKFNFSIFNSYPEKLYGDYIKIKQIVLSIVSNSIKYTENGFIDLEIDTVTRYDVCRSIFTIKDSGKGMSISKINKLLSSNNEIDKVEFDKIDGLDLDIPTVIKIIKMLGGSISIKSEEGKGTIVVVVIDQKISGNNGQIESTKNYTSTVKSNKRILVASDDDMTDKVARLLKNCDVDVITTLAGHDCVDKINAGDYFDLIIMKDEMKPDSAYTILKELKRNKKFKVPVIIIIDKNKDFIKEHFIEDGFSDYIVKENIEVDMKRIIEKYIN